MTYDSTAETLQHTIRVGELIMPMIQELAERSIQHDISKTQPPEKEVFDECTPRLKDLTYGTDEYFQCLREMKPALDHHYASNRHHPEHFGERGINGMTLMDLIEMLADWKAAGERNKGGNLAKSLDQNRGRFNIDDQLFQILLNTAGHLGWLPTPTET